MSELIGPASGRPSLFTVNSGLELLDEWSAHATQAQKNIVNRVIFAVADKKVFSEYDVIDDIENHMEFFVLAKNELTVKIRIDGFDSFAILYVGPTSAAPGLNLTQSASMQPVSDSLPADERPQNVWRHV